MLRSRQRNLNLLVNLDLKAFDNWSSFGPTSKYNVDVLTVGLNGNSFDMLGGGGANFASLSLVGGSVDLSGSANQANDAASAQTEGHYTKLKLSVSRNQSVTDQISIYGQLAMQRANRNLDSSEKLTLGGASGVRAYPSGEAIGDDGQTLSLEARFRLQQGFSITGFYDWGRITAINHDNTAPSGATLATLNAYSLSGYGLSASWVSPIGLQLKGSWVHRLGSNPNPTPNGLDQDGSQRINRFWLTASLPF
jgi:hemolysin activation/secretion protein